MQQGQEHPVKCQPHRTKFNKLDGNNAVYGSFYKWGQHMKVESLTQ